MFGSNNSGGWDSLSEYDLPIELAAVRAKGHKPLRDCASEAAAMAKYAGNLTFVRTFANILPG